MEIETKKIEEKYIIAEECPITIFMEQIGGKWKPVIIWVLLSNEVMRFNELDKTIKGISQKMLSQQLKDLEQLEVITRKSYPVIPPKVEYRLTEKGKSLAPLLTAMKAWVYENLNKQIS
ncbi:HTH-type transcriptional activator HxlR [Mariniflexile rhizosphaerae]|uniref:winged helix-turn-helix transcriptional regulator n=1 Tax=unclassified Mariniflexile TaxID=2643887 RepID=UPI000CC57E9A|nr:helix-turn-helix domain-containing protein [Mariniflexile sp. TRM1-10]AXP81982.1 HTH-type transcriptional activator HxlR [Mariniflexile sp. TRM1-10]PLB19159.1 MAG: Transcriptional regulator, HxlR family [Flavobacteriaceae bacterium FS1-H7996/R]